MNAVHPTFSDALRGFRATVPASLPKIVPPAKIEAALRNEARRENAYERLVETATIILASMSLVDQASLHARLRSDLAAVDACNGGMQA